MNPEIIIVRNWHTALNSGDVEQLIALVDQNVEIGGSRGTARGAQMVREWFSRAHVRMYPTRFFYRDNVVVVEEAAQWRAPETGEVMDNKAVATVFVIIDGLISQIARHDDLKAALAASGLNDADEMQMD
jgi:hypothetical protein